MNTRFPVNSLGRPRLRHGLVTGVLLLVLLVLVALIGLALELGLIYHVEIQLQNACDAAALAGAVELLDDSVLYPDREPNPAERIAAAQQVALAYGQANIAAAAPVALLVDASPDSDVVAGWLLSPETRGSEFLPWLGQGPCNTLRVRALRTKARNNPLRLWIAPLVGIHDANVAARSQATIDQRVLGFRPLGATSIPLMPLVARHQEADDSWVEQAQAGAEEGDNDRFTVDFRTGQVAAGADHIPEIELRMRASGGSSSSDDDEEDSYNLGLLLLGNETTDFVRHLTAGVPSADLAPWDGQLALGSDGRLFVPGSDEFNPAWLGALQSTIGQNRIWPLFEEPGEQAGRDGYILTGFAAGCLVEAKIEDDELILFVQPSLLVSSAALVGPLPPDSSPNPWIAKLLLTH